MQQTRQCCRSWRGRTHRRQEAKANCIRAGSASQAGAELAPPSLGQHSSTDIQREVGVATHDSTPTGSLPTSPPPGEGHSRTECATMRWRAHPPKWWGSDILTRAGWLTPSHRKGLDQPPPPSPTGSFSQKAAVTTPIPPLPSSISHNPHAVSQFETCLATGTEPNVASLRSPSSTAAAFAPTSPASTAALRGVSERISNFFRRQRTEWLTRPLCPLKVSPLRPAISPSM
jgi:hypothetical protein